ncbi:hypothetical protein MODO_3573 [Myroides odoratimimus]|uniref:Uncharacterized protein n=1 Tax=Myroides odoratimimus CCUG 10230 TaxID=883150 RepID=A0ABN0EDF7_9FLAO|nr:hypothetical protein HMPREF9712_00218 [Myroides odoratimimus CCUG 10230]GAQ15868.1 hypothetical protein MODO_3573 [Myroides odoratimimus]STZ47685.1 Uncharacterised protein [Myroides odoratimimus]
MKDGLKFNVIFLEEAKEFLDHLDSKARAKIIYNINKASITSDIELFKKLQGDIFGSLEQCIALFIIGYLPFGISQIIKIQW